MNAVTASAAPPRGTGTTANGRISLELNRGAAVPFEIRVEATRNNCQSHLDLRITWNEEENWVRVNLRGLNALDPFPDVERTLDVDYRPNPFFPEPEDYTDGRYQLWIVSGAGPVLPFYYDPITLDLIGGPTDFETPPAAIPILFPTLYMFSTPMFQPNAQGNVNVNWTFPYDGAIRGDRPEFAHHIVTFPPPNLCEANIARLDQSHLRPYISAPFPAQEARPWSDYLRGGLLFDVTIEPPEYFTEPPRTSLVATYSNATSVAGTVPRGWQFDIDAAFANLAPPIRRWKGAGLCEDTFEGFHTQGLNFCPPLSP